MLEEKILWYQCKECGYHARDEEDMDSHEDTLGHVFGGWIEVKAPAGTTPKHVCGLMGFGLHPDDKCDACRSPK